MDRDSIDCWLRPVAEAKKQQLVFRQSLGNITKYFKPKPRVLPKRLPEKKEYKLTPALLSDSLTDESSLTLSLVDTDDDSTAMSSDFDPG